MKHGAKVVIADIADAAGIALANSLAPSAAYVHCDVSSEEDIEMLINKTISLFGKLDILFNNAGVLGNQSKRKSIIDFDAGEFDRVMQVNVRGAALGMKHAAKVMVPGRSGCIISTASVAGFMGGARASCLHGVQTCHYRAYEEHCLRTRPVWHQGKLHFSLWGGHFHAYQRMEKL